MISSPHLDFSRKLGPGFPAFAALPLGQGRVREGARRAEQQWEGGTVF